MFVYKNFCLVFSGILILASIVALLVWGLPLGIDFTGGSLLEVEFSGKRPGTKAIQESLAASGSENAVVQETKTQGVIIRSGYIDEPTHQEILTRLREFIPVAEGGAVAEKRFDTIGPTLGRELRNRSLLALAFASLSIIAYIAWAFRKISQPVASWKYGVSAVLALLHDVIIPTGIFAVLGRLYGVEADALFVTALLTIMAFSVHDTIVVFDRIRENLRAVSRFASFEHAVDQSIRETIGRSVSTSFAILLALGAIFFFGGATTRLFASTLATGIFFGTYSSLFLASPLLVVWERLTRSS